MQAGMMTLVGRFCVSMHMCVFVLYVTACFSVGVVSNCARVGPTLWVTDCVVTSHADTLTTDRHRYISGPA